MNTQRLTSDQPHGTRAAELFVEHRQSIARRTDYVLQRLMVFQWLAGILAAFWISPRTWSGLESHVHPHVWAALILGSLITSLPVLLAQICPGKVITRQAFAFGQMLMSALLIHLSGGRIETHFHIFGSLAILSFYRDWRVLATASATIFIDHLARGLFWPESVYGLEWAPLWRAFEHAGWIVFEDIFLFISIRQSTQEMHRIADRQAQLENTNSHIEQTVAERTGELLAENEQRRMAEEKHRKSERFLQCTLDALSAQIAILDCTGKITAVNAVWNKSAEAHGAMRTAFGPGTNYLEVCETASGDGATEARAVAIGIRRVIAGQESEFQLEYPCHSAVELRWFIVRVTCFRSENSLHMVVAHENVTARARAEQDARLRETELRALFDVMPAMIWFKDTANRILRVNKRVADEAGKSIEEIEGKQTAEIYPQQAARFYADDLKVIHSGVPKLGYVEALAGSDGQERWIQTDKTPYYDKQGQVIGIVVMAQDVTARQRAEAELVKVHQQLVETSRQAGMAEVATGVLHNVGNVLNSVNVSATLVAESIRKSKSADLSRVVTLLDQHTADLGEFVTRDPRGKNLLSYLRQLNDCLSAEQQGVIAEIESLRMNVEHIKEIVAMQQNYAQISGVTETIQIADLLEDTVRMNAESLAHHEVRIVRDFAAVPPVTVDKHKVLQILVNLVRNAKHACQATKRTDRTLTLQIFNSDGTVKIAVSDNGIGIPAENLNRIFNHGFTTKKNGHGFGLHSGALAARELGGSLTVRSEGVGQGATFTFELPCKPHKTNP